MSNSANGANEIDSEMGAKRMVENKDFFEETLQTKEIITVLHTISFLQQQDNAMGKRFTASNFSLKL